jgi:hypothetical protein
MAEADTTTISVSERTLERFKSLKRELDNEQDSVPDHTADSFVNALLDTWEAADDGYYDVDAGEIAEQLQQQLEINVDYAEIETRVERAMREVKNE